jgi:hypothetical protein
MPFFLQDLRSSAIAALSADYKEVRFANRPGEFLRNHTPTVRLHQIILIPQQEAHQQTAALLAVSNRSIKRRTPPGK